MFSSVFGVLKFPYNVPSPTAFLHEPDWCQFAPGDEPLTFGGSAAPCRVRPRQ
jgi:hypothetical protein